MNRQTRKIKGANNYCGYEIKEAPYKEIFDLKSNKEIEDYVNCDLTLAIDKLGQLEDLEEQLGCPLEVVGKAITYGIAYELKNGLIESEPHISLTECGYGYILCSGSSKRKIVENGEFQTKDYKKTFWLKEDRSE